MAIAPLASIFQDEARPQVSWVYVRKDDGWEKRQVETGRADNLAPRFGPACNRVMLSPSSGRPRPHRHRPSGSAKDQS